MITIVPVHSVYFITIFFQKPWWAALKRATTVESALHKEPLTPGWRGCAQFLLPRCCSAGSLKWPSVRSGTLAPVPREKGTISYRDIAVRCPGLLPCTPAQAAQRACVDGLLGRPQVRPTRTFMARTEHAGVGAPEADLHTPWVAFLLLS